MSAGDAACCADHRRNRGPGSGANELIIPGGEMGFHIGNSNTQHNADKSLRCVLNWSRGHQTFTESSLDHWFIQLSII